MYLTPLPISLLSLDPHLQQLLRHLKYHISLSNLLCSKMKWIFSHKSNLPDLSLLSAKDTSRNFIVQGKNPGINNDSSLTMLFIKSFIKTCQFYLLMLSNSSASPCFSTTSSHFQGHYHLLTRLQCYPRTCGRAPPPLHSPQFPLCRFKSSSPHGIVLPSNGFLYFQNKIQIPEHDKNLLNDLTLDNVPMLNISLKS